MPTPALHPSANKSKVAVFSVIADSTRKQIAAALSAVSRAINVVANEKDQIEVSEDGQSATDKARDAGSTLADTFIGSLQ